MNVLVKLGGTLLDQTSTRVALARQIAHAARTGHRVVVVHGGGRQLTAFLAERGVESRFVNGLRVSTPEVIEAVLKVLAGSVNHQLVAALVEAGVAAVGLSGIDAGLIEAEPVSEELGAVGRPARANAALLELLIDHSYLPVVASIAGDRRGRIYNVNADQMAAACASAFGANRLLYLTDVDGVRDDAGAVLPSIDRGLGRRLIEEGIATGGMLAKLNAAAGALNDGVEQVVIAPGSAPGIVERLIAGESVGTKLLP